jgi:hypothetical protein
VALILRQSTAVDVLIGPFVDRTDGFTSETGESPTVKLSKNGQTLGAKSDITTPVHDADGYYNCELDATDTNTQGTLVLTVAASANAAPVRHEYMVLDEHVYDSLWNDGTAPTMDNLDVNVIQWLGTAAATPTTAGVPEVDVTFIGGGAVPAPAVTGVPDVNVTHISDGAVPAPAATGVPDVNVTYINDNAAAASNLSTGAQTVITGSFTGTPSTTTGNTDITGYTDDQLIGRVLYITSGNADGEATEITDYANTNGVLTYTALSTAPAASDTFYIG